MGLVLLGFVSSGSSAFSSELIKGRSIPRPGFILSCEQPKPTTYLNTHIMISET